MITYAPSAGFEPSQPSTRQTTAKIQKQFERGLVTDEERRQELVEIWTEAAKEVGEAMEKAFEERCLLKASATASRHLSSALAVPASKTVIAQMAA